MTIRKSIHVNRPVERTFRLFTEAIGKWWPLKEGFSFGGSRADAIFIEGRQGGRFFERFTDGEEFDVGVVTVYAPPTRIVFTWKPRISTFICGTVRDSIAMARSAANKARIAPPATPNALRNTADMKAISGAGVAGS